MSTLDKRNYPYNCWYVAATVAEVTSKPLCRWLLDRRLVVFRTGAGDIAALEDRCAHRWGALSQGKMIGDEIACPYHGFRYDTLGQCTHIPTQSSVPARLKVRSYPVREHGTFVWIWMGDEASADVALLPEIPWYTDASYGQFRGHTEINCNYLLLQENVLDLTHLPHVHADAQQDGWLDGVPEVKVGKQTVTYTKTIRDMAIAPALTDMMGVETGKRMNRVDWGTFASPACHVSGSDYEDITPPVGGRRVYNLRSMHCTTPISHARCHYWWAFAQDFAQDLPAKMVDGFLLAVVQQDKEVLEAIQTTIDEDLCGERPAEILVASDRAVVEARRIVQRMLELESRSGG